MKECHMDQTITLKTTGRKQVVMKSKQLDNKLDTTIDEWRAEMERLRGGNDPGKTTAELARELGIPERTMLRQVRKLVEEGRCVVGTTTRLTTAGHCRRVPVYQLISNKKSKK